MQKINTFLFASLCFFALSFVTTKSLLAQEAGDAWGHACGFTAGTPQSGNFYDFDLTTGNSTDLGSLCGTGTTILTGEFVDGVYYGINQVTNELITIADDASCTTIGTISITDSETGLSHDPSTGITYLLTSSGGASSNLYTIDLETADISLVGSFSGIGISLAIDGSGNAFILNLDDNIYSIDLTTGAVSNPVPLVDTGGNPIDLAFAQDGDFECDDSVGTLYAIIYQGGGTGEFGTIDPITGVFTSISFIGTEICGFSINNMSSITLVPTMTEWGLFLFGLSMVTLGLVFVYNKQRQLA